MNLKTILSNMKRFSQLINNSINENRTSLNEANLGEMARVGFIEGNRKFEVYVWTDDGGNIPHVHVRSIDRSFETCVKLTKAEYFHHGNYKGEFNSKEKKAFYKFMKAKSKNERYSTNYEYACSMWNDNNSNISISENHKMPNYSQL